MEYKLVASFCLLLLADVSQQSPYGLSSQYHSSSGSSGGASHAGTITVSGDIEGSDILNEVAKGLKEVLGAAQGYANAGAQGGGSGYGVPYGYGGGHLSSGGFAGSYGGSFGGPNCKTCEYSESTHFSSSEEKYTGPFPGPSGSIYDSKPIQGTGSYGGSGSFGGGSNGGGSFGGSGHGSGSYGGGGHVGGSYGGGGHGGGSYGGGGHGGSYGGSVHVSGGRPNKPTTVIVVETTNPDLPGSQGSIYDSKPVPSGGGSYHHGSGTVIHYSGPFPGPSGSIYDSKPANSAPPTNTNNQNFGNNYGGVRPINTDGTHTGNEESIYDSKPINTGHTSGTFGPGNSGRPNQRPSYGGSGNGGSYNPNSNNQRPNYGSFGCSTPGGCNSNNNGYKPENGRVPQCSGEGCYGQNGPKTTNQNPPKPVTELNLDFEAPKLPDPNNKVITSYQPPPSGIPPGFPGSSDYVNPPTGNGNKPENSYNKPTSPSFDTTTITTGGNSYNNNNKTPSGPTGNDNLEPNQKNDCANGDFCIGHPNDNPFESFGTSTSPKPNYGNSGQHVTDDQTTKPNDNPFNNYGSSSSQKPNYGNSGQHTNDDQTTKHNDNPTPNYGNSGQNSYGSQTTQNSHTSDGKPSNNPYDIYVTGPYEKPSESPSTAPTTSKHTEGGCYTGNCADGDHTTPKNVRDDGAIHFVDREDVNPYGGSYGGSYSGGIGGSLSGGGSYAGGKSGAELISALLKQVGSDGGASGSYSSSGAIPSIAELARGGAEGQVGAGSYSSKGGSFATASASASAGSYSSSGH